MVVKIERGQRLYVADEPDDVFEGAVLDVDPSAGVIHLDPLARLTLDPRTRTWWRTPLPKGPARVAAFAVVHDEENEARHYAQRRYASPLGDPGVWSHPSKRVWTLTTGARITTSVCAAAASPLQEPAAPVIEVTIRKPGKRQERTGQTTLPNA